MPNDNNKENEKKKEPSEGGKTMWFRAILFLTLRE